MGLNSAFFSCNTFLNIHIYAQSFLLGLQGLNLKKICGFQWATVSNFDNITVI